MSAVLSTPAFLLHSSPLGESDRLLTFYTQHAGKIRGVAKGAKKSQKRFGGALDFFHLLKLQYKPGRASDLYYFESVTLIRRSEAFIMDLAAFSMGHYFLELVKELTRDQYSDEQVFDLLHAGLQRLEALVPQTEISLSMEDLARFFELQLMAVLGFKPVLEECLDCRLPISEAFVDFSLLRGGVVCGTCRRKHEELVRRISASTLERLREALKSTDFPAQVPRFSDHEHREAKGLLSDYIAQHTHRPLRSLKFSASLTRL